MWDGNPLTDVPFRTAALAPSGTDSHTEPHTAHYVSSCPQKPLNEMRVAALVPGLPLVLLGGMKAGIMRLCLSREFTWGILLLVASASRMDYRFRQQSAWCFNIHPFLCPFFWQRASIAEEENYLPVVKKKNMKQASQVCWRLAQVDILQSKKTAANMKKKHC